MSSFESNDTIRRHYGSLTTGDLLAFEDWPEEQRRVARAVVKHEVYADESMQDEIAQAKEDGIDEGRDAAEAFASAAYEKVKEIHAQIALEVRALRVKLPDELDEDCESILAQIADLPDELE